MKRRRVNGEAGGLSAPAAVRRSAVSLVVVAIGVVAAGCPTVHRYGPDEGQPAGSSVRITARQPPPGAGSHRVASPLGEQLGDGSLRGELLAGARRVVGWRFGREDVTESDAFRLHLQAVAVWDGDAVAVVEPVPGDIWRGSGAAFGVVEVVSGGERRGVISVGSDGVVGRRDVIGGRFERPVGAAGARVRRDSAGGT